MTKMDVVVKEGITKLSKKDLEKLVLKAASMHTRFRDYLLVNYIDAEYGEQDLFESARAELSVLRRKNYKGISEELRLANMLAACNKKIVDFSKVCKNRSLEMDLIIELLRIPFSLPPDYYRTCFTKFNYQVYLLVRKAITLLNTKLHEDYRIQYAPEINRYLAYLHEHSSHLDYIYDLPKKV